jgi:PAS domain S-box-containing protein
VTGAPSTDNRRPRLAAAAAGITAGTGAACLGAYLLGLRRLVRIVASWPPMSPWTGMYLILLGGALWLLSPPRPTPAARRAAHAAALPVAVSAVVVLTEYATGHDLGVDRLMFHDTVTGWFGEGPPGRPSPHGATATLFGALALLFLDVRTPRRRRPASLLAPATAIVAAVAALGYLYGLPYLYGGADIAGMSVPGAVAYLVLAVGLLASRPDRPAVRMFASAGLGGQTVRRLAPGAAAIVVLAGLLMAAGGPAHAPVHALAVTLVTLLLVATLYLVFLRTGSLLNHAHAEHTALVELLREQRDFSQAVIDSLREGLIVVDEQGTVLRVSPRWSALTGWPAERVVGVRPPYPWWPPEAVQACTAGERSECELSVLRPDGTAMPTLVNVAPIRHPDGRFRMAVATYADLSERVASQETGRQLDRFFTMSHDLLCIVGTDGWFKRVNPAWTRTLGWSAEELLGRPYIDLVHPDDRTHTEATAAAAAVGEATRSFINRYRRADGGWTWLNWNATAVSEQRLIYGVARDVTAEREVAETRSRLAAIVASSDDAIIGKTLDGVITSWNPGAERIYGYRAEDVLGSSIALIFPPEELVEMRDILARVAAGESVKSHDLARVTRDGRQLHVSLNVSPIRDRHGTVVGAASIGRDVTDRWRADERFRALVLSAPYAMVITDAAGTIVLANDQAGRLFGGQAADLMGRPVESLMPARLRPLHVDLRRAYLASPHSRVMGYGMQFPALRADGTEFPVEVSLSPLETEEGVLVSAAIHDVTERRLAEDALAAARDEALAATQLKSQFVAIVSHEIRTPLNGVIGLTELLGRTELTPLQRRYNDAVRTSARGLLTIINDILDFSKIEAGKLEIVTAEFDLGGLIEEVVNAAAEAARDKAVEIIGWYPPDLPAAVSGDAGRIRQVLLNLTSNGVKFTADGEIVVRVVRDDGGPDRWCFSVTDTGIGIEPATLSRLFEPFTQADATTSRTFGGTGLGLAISRQLVELLGGTIAAVSVPGEGSRFSFALALPAAAGARPRRGGGRSPMSGRRLLVVDDNAASRSVLAEHARAWGLAVDTAAGAEVAMGMYARAAAQARPFDIVVVDRHMPGDDGNRLVRHVLDSTDPPPLLILLTSGPHEADSGTVPADVVLLPKPVVPSSLYDCLVARLSPPPEPSPAEAAPAGADVPTGRGRILVAEDNEINQLVAVDTLALLGFTADVANDGAEAVELGSGGTHYDAILMDCQMPKMDGFQATAELRRRERDRHVPVIAMTAGALAEDRQRCADAGMDDYVAKPVDVDELRAVLDRWTAVPVRPSRDQPVESGETSG